MQSRLVSVLDTVLGQAPVLDLNFASSKTLDSRITFTRGSSGTFINSAGLVESAASGVARFTHNPSTLASLGLLIEESRTNLLLRSEEFDNISWTKSNLGATSGFTAPNATSTAFSLIPTAGNSNHFASSSSISTVAGAYTASIYVKAAGYGFAMLRLSQSPAYQIRVNLSTGEIQAPETAPTSSFAQPLPNGWWRIGFTATLITTSQSFQVAATPVIGGNTIFTADGTSGILIWGAQLEAGAFATSYIPTTSATATRAADVATMTGTNFSSWYRQDEGTFVVEYIPIGGGSSPAYIFASQVDDGSLANRHLLLHSSDGTTGANRPRAFSAVGGAPQADIYSTQQQALGAFGKLGLAYQLNNYAAAFSGAMLGTDSLATVPSVNVLRIGRDHSGGSFSTIARIRYYRRRLPNANLQTLTT